MTWGQRLVSRVLGLALVMGLLVTYTLIDHARTAFDRPITVKIHHHHHSTGRR